jgi:phenylpropionate dioxygenase-like ring-hydroxylating dioxygenase large terminal subunit
MNRRRHWQRYQNLPEQVLQHIPPRTTTYTQLVPYSYNTLLENILDISHVPFAHHQLQGTRADAGTDSDDDRHVISSNSSNSSTEEGQHSVVQKPSIDNIVSLSLSSHTNNTNQKKDHRHGFSFYFRDQTMRMPRMGTGTFRAPYVIVYEAIYNTTKATTTTTDLQQRWKQSRKKKKDDETATMVVPMKKTFNLTTIVIPVQPGWSKNIFGGPMKQPTSQPQRRIWTSSSS